MNRPASLFRDSFIPSDPLPLHGSRQHAPAGRTIIVPVPDCNCFCGTTPCCIDQLLYPFTPPIGGMRRIATIIEGPPCLLGARVRMTLVLHSFGYTITGTTFLASAIPPGAPPNAGCLPLATCFRLSEPGCGTFISPTMGTSEYWCAALEFDQWCNLFVSGRQIVGRSRSLYLPGPPDALIPSGEFTFNQLCVQSIPNTPSQYWNTILTYNQNPFELVIRFWFGLNSNYQPIAASNPFGAQFLPVFGPGAFLWAFPMTVHYARDPEE